MAIVSGGTDGGREARAPGRGAIFPGLEVFIGVGLLAGLIASVAISGLSGRPDAHRLILAGQGAALGGILGLFIGLGRGVWRPGPAGRGREPAPSPSPELWDPWLDHGRDDEPGGGPSNPAESEAAILTRAAVRPRVFSRQTGEAIPLEEEIGPMIQEGRGGVVAIAGGSGSGKSTAIRHLAAILPPWARGRVRLFEKTIDPDAIEAGTLVIIVADLARIVGTHEAAALFAASVAATGGRPSIYRLAPWSQDDAIEYLLTTDRGACASVMGRLRASRDFSFLEGIPELCAVVLDRMARDESIGDVRAALRLELADRIEGAPIRRDRLADVCVDQFRNTADAGRPEAIAERAAGDPAGGSLGRLIRHRPATLLLAADRIAAVIRSGRATRALAHRYDRELVHEVARMIADDAGAIGHLSRWIGGGSRGLHPLAASLLHAATPGWRPEPGRRPNLEGAYLDRAAWPDQDLAGVNLRRARLRGADLNAANLEGADARRACLHGANLQHANLRRWQADGADLGRADLSEAQAQGAGFRGADLSGARLVEANLWEADLTGARIEGTDFTGANLDDARLRGLPLCLARFAGARFGGADLRVCTLEDLALDGPDFHDADLRGAVLTSSQMPDANLLGTDLRGARLAEVDWPGACLRDADLRGVSFHLGTTRSGLVDSPIACEGSRTGFYTDDDLDGQVRPAEEIRKANLRGADIRGADIRGVDFYLVDLRGALYHPDQAEHLRRCRAILDDREG